MLPQCFCTIGFKKGWTWLNLHILTDISILSHHYAHMGSCNPHIQLSIWIDQYLFHPTQKSLLKLYHMRFSDHSTSKTSSILSKPKIMTDSRHYTVIELVHSILQPTQSLTVLLGGCKHLVVHFRTHCTCHHFLVVGACNTVHADKWMQQANGYVIYALLRC
jgi:hypothetical protein